MKQSVKLSMLWLLTGTLLTGCVTQANTSQTENETTGASETESVSESSTVATEQEEQKKEFIPVEYEGDFFTWCDPEQTLYVSWQNVDKDVYPGLYSNRQYFEILSLEHINPEDIEIILPIESDYYIEIYEKTNVRETAYQNALRLGPNTVSGSDHYPYVLYHCYQGIDWKTMLELNLAAEKADNSKLDIILSEGGLNSEEYETLDSVKKAYELYHSQYREPFKALETEDLPLFYYYRVDIFIGDENGDYKDNFFTRESFESIDIKIGEKIYTQDIGQIRIHEESVNEFEDIYACEYLYDRKEIDDTKGRTPANVGSASDGASYPWGDGIACVEAFEFSTLVDITLTKCELFAQPADSEILGARVRTGNIEKDGNVGMDFYWDLQSPIYIEAENNVIIDVFYKDSDLGKLEYSTVFGFLLEYETEGKTVRKYNVVDYNRYQFQLLMYYRETYFATEEIGAPWLRYAVIVDEIDVESYINDYFRPLNETWKWELPW